MDNKNPTLVKHAFYLLNFFQNPVAKELQYIYPDLLIPAEVDYIKEIGSSDVKDKTTFDKYLDMSFQNIFEFVLIKFIQEDKTEIYEKRKVSYKSDTISLEIMTLGGIEDQLSITGRINLTIQDNTDLFKNKFEAVYQNIIEMNNLKDLNSDFIFILSKPKSHKDNVIDLVFSYHVSLKNILLFTEKYLLNSTVNNDLPPLKIKLF